MTGVEARQACLTGVVSPFSLGDGAWGDGAWGDGAWGEGTWGDGAWGESRASFPSLRTCARRGFFVGNGSSSLMELLDRFCKRRNRVYITVLSF